MRPRIFALLAVSAIALVGCAQAEVQTAEPTASASISPSPKLDDPVEVSASEPATQKAQGVNNSQKQAEDQFFEFANDRAELRATKVSAPKAEVIEQLHGYCDDGSKINVSPEQSLNANLELAADKGYCELVGN